MLRPRPSTPLNRLVLAWFVCVVLVAGLSPWFKPASALQMICSGGSVKWLSVTPDEPAEVERDRSVIGHTLECPLCMPLHVPLPPAHHFAVLPSPLAYVLQPIAAAHLVALTAAPLPARGPPRAL